MEIYRQDKTLYNKKWRNCGQDAVINASIWLGVPISQDIIYQQFHPDIKVYKKLRHNRCSQKNVPVFFRVLQETHAQENPTDHIQSEKTYWVYSIFACIKRWC